MRGVQNSPKTGFHPCLRRSVLEDVCVHNNGILEVSTSRSTASSSNSSNNNTTIISSKLICFNNWMDLSNTLKPVQLIWVDKGPVNPPALQHHIHMVDVCSKSSRRSKATRNHSIGKVASC